MPNFGALVIGLVGMNDVGWLETSVCALRNNSGFSAYVVSNEPKPNPSPNTEYDRIFYQTVTK